VLLRAERRSTFIEPIETQRSSTTTSLACSLPIDAPWRSLP
jgi:hypothetical protein